MNSKYKQYIYELGILLVLFLNGCVEFKDPGIIYDEKATYPPSPSITAIIPADSAEAGVREIEIRGSNFSTTLHNNFVFFDKRPAYIKSALVDKLILYRPPIYGDSITLVLEVAGSLQMVKRTYKIKQPYVAYSSDAIRTVRPSDPLMAVEVDKNEVVYIAKSYFIYKLTSDETVEIFKRHSGGDFTRIYDIKFGPGGYLYIAASKTKIWRTLGENDTKAYEYVSLPSSAGVVEKIEFDRYGNLFTGKTRGIFVVKHNRTVLNTGKYSTNFTITDLRIYNDELYVNATYTGTDVAIPKQAIWKNTIYRTGTLVDSLGVGSVVFNIGSLPSFTNAEITSFTFDVDGMLYLCVKFPSSQLYSFYTLEGGALVPFYTDYILPMKIDQVVWGNATTLYLNRGRTSFISGDSAQLYRVPTLKQGAPYWGRIL
ncbi:MAG: hypothetical protein N3A63_04840 [Bacteroidetes bacterium]|nr:hypothetical protein [Bacteroidota bacterium]